MTLDLNPDKQESCRDLKNPKDPYFRQECDELYKVL